MTFLVTALQAEARPLVELFGLKGSDRPSPFRMYHGEELSLVITGVGRVASAAAVGYAFAACGERRDRPWINVGIAGHAEAEVGTAWLAHKISDKATGRTWYPSLVFEPPAATAEVVTVDRVESRFEDDALYDMEASGFAAVASRMAVVELIQVLKIVSDNLDAPASELDGERVSTLVAARSAEIAQLVSATRDLAARLRVVPVELEPWIEGRRFSVSQRRKLKSLLSRLSVLESGNGVPPSELENCRSASGLLAALEQRLRDHGASYQP